MTSPESVEVWTFRDDEGSEKAALPRLGATRAFDVFSVDPAVLTGNLRDFLSHFQALDLDPEVQGERGFAIQEIELSLGINGTGGIALLGKVEVGVAAGIKVKLVRRGKSPKA